MTIPHITTPLNYRQVPFIYKPIKSNKFTFHTAPFIPEPIKTNPFNAGTAVCNGEVLLYYIFKL